MTERFELLEKLGQGGMGVVWKARDAETGRIIALKLLHAHFLDDPEFVARFEREVDIASRIGSPFTVTVLGYGMREQNPYVAMEYVPGGTLHEMIATRGPISWMRAKPLLCDVAHALDVAHAARVIHRDVKPSNILLGYGGVAKLADFGIARAVDATTLTTGTFASGTPAYMAPDPRATASSDLYSLGCVAYFMLTGSPVFHGESQQEVIIQHLRSAPDAARIDDPDARRFCAWLLEKEPSARPSDAQAVLRYLGCDRPEPAYAAGAEAFGPGSIPAPMLKRSTWAQATRLALVALLGPAPLLAGGLFALLKFGQYLPTANEPVDLSSEELPP